MEKFFDYMRTANDKQECLVAYKLKGEHLPGRIVCN